MKVRQTADELIIEDAPAGLWLFGLFFLVVSSIFVYGALGGFSDYDKIPNYAIWFSFFAGAIGISVGVWQIYRAPFTKIIVNRQAKTVTHIRHGLFGKEKIVYGFDQVKQFRTVEDKDSDGDPIWYFGMEFHGGKFIEISSMPSRSEKYKQDVIFKPTSLYSDKCLRINRALK
ncbi:MAG: hypothetical protein M3033_08945 [Acidobacteriota bacterium]|nr:hypothetical protein [Acidobacteriota bacterium]